MTTIQLSDQCHASEARELLHRELERAYRHEFEAGMDRIIERVLDEDGAAMDMQRPDRFEQR